LSFLGIYVNYNPKKFYTICPRIKDAEAASRLLQLQEEKLKTELEAAKTNLRIAELQEKRLIID
jgi:hypothetical protein